MLAHYTSSLRRFHLRSFLFDAVLPLLWLAALFVMGWDDGLMPFWFVIAGLSYILFRVVRRTVRGADAIETAALTVAGMFFSLSVYSIKIGSGIEGTMMGMGGILFVVVAVVYGYGLRLARLESPVNTKRNAEFPGIYCITCVPNGKQYIGQTAQPIRDRWKRHLALLNSGLHHNRWLQADWNTYRPDQFVFSVLEIVTDPVWLLDRERCWQDKDYDPVMRYNPPNIPTTPRQPHTRRKSN